jgi:SAM-dependent methyltransferase
MRNPKRPRTAAGGTGEGTAPATAEDASPPAPAETPARRRSAAFSRFLRSYRGLEDLHLPLFATIARALALGPQSRVLYPGSFNHITASLAFANVTYVDCDRSVGAVFSDPVALAWVRAHRLYADAEPALSFCCANYERLRLEEGSFDLLISLSAGLVSPSCARFVRQGGHLLVGDAHYDARRASTDPTLALRAVYDLDARELDWSAEALRGHFESARGVRLTADDVRACVEGRRRPAVGVARRSLFYVFEKL